MFDTQVHHTPNNSMQEEKGIIIGNNSVHGQEFVQLALKDYQQVLVASGDEMLRSSHIETSRIGKIEQDLGSDDMAINVIEELEFFEEMGSDAPLTLVVNLVEFNEHDPWEEGTPANPSINISQLMELNEFFAHKMLKQGQGEILNVISKPEKCPEFITEMFHQTRALLMEVADELNQSLTERGVNIHTLSYSPQSFALQSSSLPAKVAHDMAPKSCSARDIADYGYQVLRARRGTSGG
ncbi:MAG: hypothetical protein MRZ79_08575 [Bacteroidia bacterium]|nr:hypothetical protein [Bacteroidia bacterium]